jgi:excisionase family DNA binding protein
MMDNEMTACINEIENQKQQEKRVYTVPEVQDILGVSNTTVYRLMKRGAFRGVHIGNVVRISKRSFDKWIAEQI